MSQRLFGRLLPTLLVSAGAVIVFGILAWCVREQTRGTYLDRNPITQLDGQVADSLHEYQNANTGLKTICEWVSKAGDMLSLVVAACAVSLVLFHFRQAMLTLVWILILLGGEHLNRELKGVFQRPRPSFPDLAIAAKKVSWSFPSGHAMESMIGYGMLAYVLALMVPRPRVRIALVALLVLLIGFSRLFLGAHYLSDVLAGYAAGAAWLALWIGAMETVQRWWKTSAGGGKQ